MAAIPLPCGHFNKEITVGNRSGIAIRLFSFHLWYLTINCLIIIISIVARRLWNCAGAIRLIGVWLDWIDQSKWLEQSKTIVQSTAEGELFPSNHQLNKHFLFRFDPSLRCCCCCCCCCCCHRFQSITRRRASEMRDASCRQVSLIIDNNQFNSIQFKKINL